MFGAWRNCGENIQLLRGCADVPAVNVVTGPGAVDGQGFME